MDRRQTHGKIGKKKGGVYQEVLQKRMLSIKGLVEKDACLRHRPDDGASPGEGGGSSGGSPHQRMMSKKESPAEVKKEYCELGVASRSPRARCKTPTRHLRKNQFKVNKKVFRGKKKTFLIKRGGSLRTGEEKENKEVPSMSLDVSSRARF